MIGLRTKMSTARTMKVYGRSKATRTIHISRTPYTAIVN
jgi:flagellar basal body rod protein FlgF